MRRQSDRTHSREIESAILDLMRALGLRFGAFDLMLTPDGEYVFLEANTGGQFLFCEIHCRAPHQPNSCGKPSFRATAADWRSSRVIPDYSGRGVKE